MNKAKIFAILMIGLFSLFLITEVVSAMDKSEIVSAGWLPNGNRYATINDGDELDFSISIPHNDFMWGCYLRWAEVSVTLYNSENGQIVYSYLKNKLLTREEINKGFFAQYHVDKSKYEESGRYYIEVYKQEGWLVCGYGENSRSILTEKLYLTVEGEPTPIPILSEPSTEINENSAYSYQIVSMAKNGGVLKYSLTQAPSWLSINPLTGLVSGTAPEVSANTDYSIIIKVSEMIPSPDGSRSLIEVTSSTQHYTLTVKDTDSPEPVDYYSCQQNSDCIKVQAGCCNCNYGGKNTAINKLYIGGWMNWLNSQCGNVACTASISNDWTCKSNSEARCVLGKCEVVRIDPNPICGDGICDQGEECILDCGVPPEPVCGDGICETGENCPVDCEEPEPVCGDGICESGENCPADCVNPRPVCGDGVCEAGENCDPDCRPEDDDEENEYLYKDVYETKYLQEEYGRKAGETITLVEPETLRAKKGFWALLWEAIVEFFENLF